MVAPLWASCHRELNMIMGIAPLLFTTLTIPWCPWVIATDASMTGIGVVSTTLSSDTQSLIASSKHHDILTHRQQRRQQAHASATAAIVNNTNNINHNDMYDIDTLHKQFDRSPLSFIVPTCNWSTVVASRWRYRSLTINELEARAVKTAITWLRSRPSSFGTRVTLLCDSSTVTSAINRGRSSARSLRVVTRTIAGHLFCHGLHLHIHWIPTHINPADSASRT